MKLLVKSFQTRVAAAVAAAAVATKELLFRFMKINQPKKQKHFIKNSLHDLLYVLLRVVEEVKKKRKKIGGM